MGEQAVVRSQTGIATAAIEGGEVVVRLRGQRRACTFGPMVPWSDEKHVPLALATATIEGAEMTVRRGGVAVHALAGCDPAAMRAFVEELEAAKQLLAMPVAACAQCGAPGQRVGLACGYCGVAVAG
jgi:hypothetical protein